MIYIIEKTKYIAKTIRYKPVKLNLLSLYSLIAAERLLVGYFKDEDSKNLNIRSLRYNLSA